MDIPENVDLGNLRDDGDTVDLPDGRKLRLRIEPDPHATINDFDCYGKCSTVHDYIRDGKQPRPDGFDGNAEKIQVDRGLWVWWQPSSDGPKRGTPEFDKDRRQIRDLLELGFCVVGVELLDVSADHYGRGVVRDAAYLGAVEPYPDKDYLLSVVTDLVTELDTNQQS